MQRTFAGQSRGLRGSAFVLDSDWRCPRYSAARRSGGAFWARGALLLSLVVSCVLLLSVVTAPAVHAQQQGQRTHVVQSGETLGAIAQRYGVDWQELAQWNGITDATRIYAGQVLTLNAGRGGASWQTPAQRPSPGQAVWSDSGTTAGTTSGATWGGDTSTGGAHVVQAGETLVSIAQRYGITPAQLANANNLSRPPSIAPGQTLRLPGGSAAEWSAGPATSPAARNWETPANTTRPAQPQAHSAQAPQAPSSVGKVILISIAQQHLWAYENGQLVLHTPVTTGRPGADTPTGTFDVLVKYSPYRFISPYPPGHEFYYDPVDSNYSLRITWEGHHIHDAPWRTDFGAGTNLPHTNSRNQWATGSIGCVNVPTSAMAQLYAWANEGMQVTIQQ